MFCIREAVGKLPVGTKVVFNGDGGYEYNGEVVVKKEDKTGLGIAYGDGKVKGLSEVKLVTFSLKRG